MGQQEIHEHEALGDGAGRRLHCRLTSFSRVLQTFLRINLDSTDAEGITETLKASDQMEWVRKMNNIRSCAAEVVNSELIYI